MADKKKVKERYIIEIKYLDDKVEELDISTDDIQWSKGIWLIRRK